SRRRHTTSYGDWSSDVCSSDLPLRAELGLALIGIGALVTILAGPFDNLWHALFGRDVDIWSPPHLAGIAGGGIGLLGWLAATAQIGRASCREGADGAVGRGQVS